MKKSLFLLGLLTSTVCLTACGSKTFEMSFEDALEIASRSELQDILAWNDNFEQSFNIAGNFDSDWTKIDANLSSNSKQSLNNKNSDSSLNFWANITSEGETIKANWALDIKLVDDAIYLNLSSLDLTWSEDLSMVAMMTEWFKNQWFVVPVTGLSDIPDTFSVFKDSEELNNKAKEVVINKWSTVYNWKFSQFNGYNAREISLDNEKLNALIKEYYDSLYTNLDEEVSAEVPELNIQNFEWYLVITWKDKVTTVIENMEMQDNDVIMSANWFAGEDYELYLSEGEEDLISIVAEKKGWKYEVSITIADALSLNWTISAKLSKSSIDLNFDAKITVKSEVEWENDTIIPFNGSWKYKAISEFNTTAPENAQDLTEILWSYFGGMMWVDEDYDYEDYEDYDYEDLYDEYNEEPESIAEPEEMPIEEAPVEEAVAEEAVVEEAVTE